TIVVTMTDPVGHTAVVTLVPTVTFAETIVADCTPLSTACEDYDGDGVSPDSACSLPIDCNDTDAAVSPKMFEIPSDGVDNDCDGADAYAASIDPNDVVFVDPTSDGGNGTFEDPMVSIEQALSMQRRYVLLTRNGEPVIDAFGVGSIESIVIGGYDD